MQPSSNWRVAMEEQWLKYSYERLLERVRQEPTAPCEGCAFARNCRDNKLACWDFAFYTEKELRERWALSPSTNPRMPSRELFDYVFRQDERAAVRKLLPKSLKCELVYAIENNSR